MESQTSKGVSRRTMIRGAAWSLPVIAAAIATPLAAASIASAMCSPAAGRVLFGSNYVRSSATRGTAVVPLVGEGQTPVTVAFTSTMAGYTANSDNFTVGTGAWAGLQLQQTRNPTTPVNNASFGQTLTITFSRPVSDVVIPLKNFSWPISGAYGDQVRLTPQGYTFTVGSNVGGTGSPASPFRNTTASGTYTGASTNVTARFAGPITSITLLYYDRRGTTSPAQQAIAIGDIGFTASCP